MGQLTPIRFDGFVASPSTGSSASVRDSPARVDGLSLGDMRHVVIDMCNLTVSVLSRPSVFKALLRMEGIHFRSMPEDHPLAASTVRLLGAEDMRQLICKLPTRLRHVALDAYDQ